MELTDQIEQRRLLLNSYDAVVGIYSATDDATVITRHEEIAVLAKNYAAANPPSTPRTGRFLEYHNLAASSFSLLSSPSRSNRLISQNLSNYVSAVRADTQAASQTEPNTFNESPLPAQPSVPTLPPSLPPNSSARKDGPTSLPLPALANHSHAISAAHPSPQNMPDVLNNDDVSAASAPIIETHVFHPKCPNTPLPRSGPAHSVVGISTLVRDGVPFLFCHAYGGPDAEDDAAEFGIGADFIDASCRSKFSYNDGSLCLNVSLYTCRHNGCCVQKALDRQDSMSVKVHSTGHCGHVSGSLAMLPKYGGKNGLPPSINRFVRSYIRDKLNAPHASFDDLRPELTARNICLVLENNQYFFSGEAKECMKEKIKNFVMNYRQKESSKKREQENSSNDGIGIISSSKQLQEFVCKNHIPLSVHGLQLPFPNVRGMSAITVDKNGRMTKLHPDGRVESHNPERFHLDDLAHLERRKYRWWDGPSEIQKVPRDQTLVYSALREEGAPTTAKKKSSVSKPTDNMIVWNSATKAPTKYSPGVFLAYRKRSSRRRGKMVDPSRNHIATSKEMMGYESSGSEFDPDEPIRLSSSLMNELSVGNGKIMHPTPRVVMLSRALQIDLQSLFHSKYGRRVNYYFDAKRNDVDGAMLWEAVIHFDARDGKGWQVVESIGPDFASPIGLERKKSVVGYRSKNHAMNAVIMKYLAVLHPEEITSWTHLRLKEGEIIPILQLQTNGGKQNGVLSREKNGDKIYIFDDAYLEMVDNKKMEPSDSGVQLLCKADADWTKKIGGSKSRQGNKSTRRKEKRRRKKKRKKDRESA